MSSRHKELDALRGIAAIMVVLFHFTMGTVYADLGFKYGTTGVDLFFIISGFVIFMSINRISKSTDFIFNRFIRLYPTYWVSVTFTFILYSISVHNTDPNSINLIQYFGNMSMFQFYLRIPDLDEPYWTMIIEMLFYIGIWLTFHFKFVKYINIIGIFLCISAVVATQFCYDIPLVRRIFFWIPLLKFLPLFFAGTLFYKIYVNKSKLIQNYFIVSLCLVCQILLFRFSGRSSIYIDAFEYCSMLAIFFLVFTLFVNDKLNFIVNFATLFLGRISFPLYLTHQFISLKFLLPFFQIKLNTGLWVAIICTLPITILIASFITFVIEAPLTKTMKYRWFQSGNSENLGDRKESQ